MVQSPSWEANWFAASQEIPRILWDPKVHYRTHKRLPPVPILCQSHPVHIPISHLLEINPNIIHPSMPRSPQWSLTLRFPHQDPIRPPLLTHTHHIPSPSHSSRFYHPHNVEVNYWNKLKINSASCLFLLHWYITMQGQQNTKRGLCTICDIASLQNYTGLIWKKFYLDLLQK